MSDFELVDMGEHNRLKQELAEAKAKVHELQERVNMMLDDYHEIIMEVKNKYPHMTRHRQAIEIIKAYENQNNPPSSAPPERKSLGESKNWGDE